jgi:hypothetical protein
MKRLTLFIIGLAIFASATLMPDLFNVLSVDVGGSSFMQNLGTNLAILIGGVIVCKAIFKD